MSNLNKLKIEVDLEQATKEYHRAVADAEYARERLYDLIYEATMYHLPLSKIEKMTGFKRQRVIELQTKRRGG